MCTKQTGTDNPVMFTQTTVGGRETPTITTPPGNTDKSPPTPSGPRGSSTDHANMQLDGKIDGIELSKKCTYTPRIYRATKQKEKRI